MELDGLSNDAVKYDIAGKAQADIAKDLNITATMYRQGNVPNTSNLRYGDIVDSATGKPIPAGTAPIGKAVERADLYVEKLASSGLPYAGIDRRSRVMAVDASQATSQIGKTIFENEALKSGNATAKNIAEHIDSLNEFGQMYFMGQGKDEAFGLALKHQDQAVYSLMPFEDLPNTSRNIILPYDIYRDLDVSIRDAEGNITHTVKLGTNEYLDQAQHHAYLSVVKTSQKNSEDIVNVVHVHNFGEVEAHAIEDSTNMIKQAYRKLLNVEYTQEADKQPIKQLRQVILNKTGHDLSAEQTKTLIEGGDLKTSMPNAEIAENVQREYERIVTEQAEHLRENGLIGLNVKGETGAALSEVIEHHASEMGASLTDIQAQQIPAKITSFYDQGASLSPMRSTIAGQAAVELETGKTGIEVMDQVHAEQRAADIAALEGQAATADELARNATLRTAVKQESANLDVDKMRPFEVWAEEFMAKNKKKIAVGAALVGSALVARHFYRKHRQNQQYESTIMMSEPEIGERPYGAQEALFNARQARSTSDPLATAGVVGNLDRRKIGHTNMGPNKYQHLY